MAALVAAIRLGRVSARGQGGGGLGARARTRGTRAAAMPAVQHRSPGEAFARRDEICFRIPDAIVTAAFAGRSAVRCVFFHSLQKLSPPPRERGA